MPYFDLQIRAATSVVEHHSLQLGAAHLINELEASDTIIQSFANHHSIGPGTLFCIMYVPRSYVVQMANVSMQMSKYDDNTTFFC